MDTGDLSDVFRNQRSSVANDNQDDMEKQPNIHDKRYVRLGNHRHISSKSVTRVTTGGGNNIEDDIALNVIRAKILDRKNVILSAIDLANTIMGTGILSMPYGFSMVGLGFGTLLVIGSMVATWFSLQLLVSAANYASKNSQQLIPPTPSSKFTPQDEEERTLLYPTISVSVLDLNHNNMNPSPSISPTSSQLHSQESGHINHLSNLTYVHPRESLSSIDSEYSPNLKGEPHNDYEQQSVDMVPRASYDVPLEDSTWDDVDAHEWSYGWLAMKTWKSRKRAIWTDLAIMSTTLGFAVSYLVSIGDVMPEAIRDAFPESWKQGILKPFYFLHSGHFWIIFFSILIAPITFGETFDGFGWFGLSALTCALFEAAVVIIGGVTTIFSSNQAGTDRKWMYFGKDIQWFIFKWDAVGTIPIFTFAFTCHQNIFGIYKDIKHRFHAHDPRLGPVLVKHVRVVIDYAVLGVGILYLIVGTIGYLAFGSSTKVIILDSFSPSVYIIVARVLYSYLAALSFPMQAHPVRESILNILSLCGIIPKEHHPSQSRRFTNSNSDKSMEHIPSSSLLNLFNSIFHESPSGRAEKRDNEFTRPSADIGNDDVESTIDYNDDEDDDDTLSASVAQTFLSDTSLSKRGSRSSPATSAMSGTAGGPMSLTPISRRPRGPNHVFSQRMKPLFHSDMNDSTAVQTNVFLKRRCPRWLRPIVKYSIKTWRKCSTFLRVICVSGWMKTEEGRRFVISFAIVISSILITWFVTNLDDIITFVGATSGVLVCYILPALLYRAFVMRSSESNQSTQRNPTEEDGIDDLEKKITESSSSWRYHRQVLMRRRRSRAWWKSCIALQLAFVGALSGIFNLYWLLSRSATPTESRQIQPRPTAHPEIGQKNHSLLGNGSSLAEKQANKNPTIPKLDAKNDSSSFPGIMNGTS